MTTGINSVSGTTATQTTTKSAAQTSKDEFLKLLTYQLKSQNPMKPYDNQEFASQLAQFSQLEQLVDIKSLLQESSNSNSILTQTIANSALPGMLGKNAKAETSIFNFDGEKQVKLGFDVQRSVSSGSIKIMTESGQTIRTIKLEAKDITNGNNTFNWDGKDDDGNTMGAGKYKVEVNLNESSGSSYTADTYLYGKVEAVRFKTEGTMLVINGTESPLGKVIDIADQ